MIFPAGEVGRLARTSKTRGIAIDVSAQHRGRGDRHHSLRAAREVGRDPRVVAVDDADGDALHWLADAEGIEVRLVGVVESYRTHFSRAVDLSDAEPKLL